MRGGRQRDERRSARRARALPPATAVPRNGRVHIVGAMNPWIDVSVPLHGEMPTWPGDPAVEVVRVSSLEAGDSASLTRLALGAHAGTHVDAPAHFLRGGVAVDAMPLETMTGPARVLGIRSAGAVGRADLEAHRVAAGERILLRTRNSDAPWFRRPFDPSFVHLSAEAAAFLAERRVRCVGVDYLSVGPFGASAENAEAHRVLLAAGVWILEGLHLGEAEPGPYELVCLPLRLEGAEGAPARAMLRRAG